MVEDFHVWATGGLETSLFAALVLGFALLAASPGNNSRALGCGCVLSLAALTRPDAPILIVVAWIAILQLPRPAAARLRLAVATALPLAVTLGAWAIFKLDYYGELFPTAFFSKSTTDPYWSQGLIYLGLFLAKNWFLAFALGLVLWFWWRPLRSHGDTDPGLGKLAGLCLATAALYGCYVVYVGGDFMFARRLVPLLALLVLAIELHLRAKLPNGRAFDLATAALVVAATLPYPVYDGDRDRIAGIANEPAYYTAEVIEARRKQAIAARAAFGGTDARLLLEGGMLSFAYYSELPYLVEMTGLTHYSLARLPIQARGKIGHEKRPTDEWLFEHGIHLRVSHDFPPIDPAQRVLNDVYVGRALRARILWYDDALMELLKQKPGLQFVPIETRIDLLRSAIAQGQLEQARRLLTRLDREYFSRASADARALGRALRARLEAADRQ